MCASSNGGLVAQSECKCLAKAGVQLGAATRCLHYRSEWVVFGALGVLDRCYLSCVGH
jgi:hypothetical protein